MKDIGKKIADIVCEAWNTLDSSLFEAILSDDFEYISIWVLETMKGKGRYMEYISGKFESIRKGNNPVSAEIVYQEVINKYVVVLNQGGNMAALEPTIIPNRSLGPIGSGDVKVFSCSPESKECLPLIHGSHKM